MKLQDILYKVPLTQVQGIMNLEITDFTSDSREVKPGSLFIAIKGTQADGHHFIAKAIKNGAVAIVCEENPHPLAPSPKEEGEQKTSLLERGPGEGPNGSNWRWFTVDPEKYLTKSAKENRKNPTPSEKLLWDNLRNHKLKYKFRREHPIGKFIADFVCIEKKLIIEVDGEYHDEYQSVFDDNRTAYLNDLGYWLIRFRNEEVENQLDLVLETIINTINEIDLNSNPHPLAPSSFGEGLNDSPSLSERGLGGEGPTFLIVSNSAASYATIACNFYQNPSEKLRLIGVTGTNGKTSVSTLLYTLFKQMGCECGLISTIEIKIGVTVYPTNHTTPDAKILQQFLNQMVLEGCEYCFMEVSSHAVVQHRITGCRFEIGIFTNITHDHLDFHGTFLNYIKAKQQFFNLLDSEAFAITNIDDKNGKVMVQNCKAEIYTYSINNPSDYQMKVLDMMIEGMNLRLDNDFFYKEFWVQLTGKFNAYNLTAVFACADQLGFSFEQIAIEMSKLLPVKGRFQVIPLGEKTAIVDYAHTPDALKNILENLAEIKTTGRIITVFGCGGDRDQTKRPEMGKIASQYSDLIIITSDNPRSETPSAIMNDIEKGIPKHLIHKVLKIENRKDAIEAALRLAQAQDTILVAGKGHENYQEVNGVKTHFDDTEIITNYEK